MVIALWIVNTILALMFIAAGLMKTLRPKPALAAAGMTYVEDFTSPFIKTIGALEVVAAFGLILPLVTGIAAILAPLAATGLAIIMIGATVVHARRKEPVAIAAALTILSIASAVLGFLVVLG
ncbi:DoxX family protein [Microbacterium sp. BWT-B31]|uniref:DoxX family protein n=1 Tax=Microbacterium sp. BWT-B31 TaxID=3232072 RepID=UPI0035291B87